MLTLFSVVKFTKIWHLLYYVRVLSQQAWRSVLDSVQYLLCQCEVIPLLQGVHPSSS